mmetsp:Transcript_5099/g.10168  ORF Transcript_5099/g.10168 Transcript_5099/m.10168 type:complete len:206 (+) Transcript_5099:80-697(+)
MQGRCVAVGQALLGEVIDIEPRDLPILVAQVANVVPDAAYEVVDDKHRQHQVEDLQYQQRRLRSHSIAELLRHLHVSPEAEQADPAQDAEKSQGLSHSQGSDDIVLHTHEYERPVDADQGEIEPEPRSEVPPPCHLGPQLEATILALIANQELGRNVQQPVDGGAPHHDRGSHGRGWLEGLKRKCYEVPTEHHHAQYVPDQAHRR